LEASLAMPDQLSTASPEPFEVRPDHRRRRLEECAQYCRRLARRSDRPEAARSLAALAAEFEAAAALGDAAPERPRRRVAAI